MLAEVVRLTVTCLQLEGVDGLLSAEHMFRCCTKRLLYLWRIVSF